MWTVTSQRWTSSSTSSSASMLIRHQSERFRRLTVHHAAESPCDSARELSAGTRTDSEEIPALEPRCHSSCRDPFCARRRRSNSARPIMPCEPMRRLAAQDGYACTKVNAASRTRCRAKLMTAPCGYRASSSTDRRQSSSCRSLRSTIDGQLAVRRARQAGTRCSQPPRSITFLHC